MEGARYRTKENLILDITTILRKIPLNMYTPTRSKKPHQHFFGMAVFILFVK
jgi:hypothetical protein